MKRGNIHLLRPIEDLDYYDTQSVHLASEVSPLQAWNLITAQQQHWLGLAFRIRDAVSTRFGVKRIGGFTGKVRSDVVVGDYLDFFLVEHIDTETLVLTERDRHLDVMTCITSSDTELTITSSVVVHNLYGRLYMMPVGLAHKFIVASMLKRLKASVDGGR